MFQSEIEDIETFNPQSKHLSNLSFGIIYTRVGMYRFTVLYESQYTFWYNTCFCKLVKRGYTDIS